MAVLPLTRNTFYDHTIFFFDLTESKEGVFKLNFKYIGIFK